jgi:epsilon-lactone hydrolase
VCGVGGKKRSNVGCRGVGDAQIGATVSNNRCLTCDEHKCGLEDVFNSKTGRALVMKSPSTERPITDFIVEHPLEAEDAAITAAMRAAASPAKGLLRGIEGRSPFDSLMEGVSPRDDVTFEPDTLGGVPGLWVHPKGWRSNAGILHLHGGWFILGSAKAFRHLVGHIATRARARAFIPDYRLAPEHPFPAATDDVLACYQAFAAREVYQVALTGDSAGGNLALGLAARAANETLSRDTTLVGVVALSPVTDLTLSGATYETRAAADPLFTRAQVADLVHAYLGNADPGDPRASPLRGSLAGLPPIRIHVGDDEVLLDDSIRYVERAVAAGVDARLDVWMGMQHGFVSGVGKLKASEHALDAIGVFLGAKWQAGT